MENTKQEKHYFIIIRGPAGVGKTATAKLLAEKLNAYVIDIDKLLEKYGLDIVDPNQGQIDEKNLLKINKITIPKVIKKLKEGKIVILDGNFYSRKQIDDLIKKIKFKSFIFTLKANLQECIKRDKTRKELGEQNIKDVYKLVSRFDYGIIVDTRNKPIEEVVKEIMSYSGK